MQIPVGFPMVLVGFDELGDFEGKVMVAMPENVNG